MNQKVNIKLDGKKMNAAHDRIIDTVLQIEGEHTCSVVELTGAIAMVMIKYMRRIVDGNATDMPMDILWEMCVGIMDKIQEAHEGTLPTDTLH